MDSLVNIQGTTKNITLECTCEHKPELLGMEFPLSKFFGRILMVGLVCHMLNGSSKIDVKLMPVVFVRKHTYKHN